MKEFNGLNNYIKNDGTVLVLGMFDGMHLGHLALFKKAKEIKEDSGITVLTFGNHFKGINRQYKTLMTSKEKAEALKLIGVDELIMEKMDKALMDTSAEDFISRIKSKINIKAVVVGFDYTFGKHGFGDVDMLKEHFERVYVVDKVEKDGEKISSTRLRECVRNSDFDEYERLCTRPYSITGTVEHGNCIGRKNDTPTINVKISEEKMTPPQGVYMTKINIAGKVYESISNLGGAPTFDRKEHILEVHVFDFNEEVYGVKVEVYFYKRIRDIKKFDECGELYARICEDIEAAKNYFRGLK